MKTNILFFGAAAGLLAAFTGSVAAQTNILRVYTAVEVEYVADAGSYYTLQGSAGASNWVDVGNPVLGNGQAVNQIFSTKDSGEVFAMWRLLVSPGPTNGYAPWHLDNVTLQMSDSASSNVVQYLSVTNGQDAYLTGNDPFEYGYSRVSANEGHVERNYSPSRRDSIVYSYSSPGSGTWVREEYEQNVLKNRAIGSFNYFSSSTNSGGTNLPPTPGALPPAPPSDLNGLVYYAFTGPSPDKYQFTQANAGVATPGSSLGEVETASGGNAFSYIYTTLGSNTASLTINFGYYGIGGDRQEYDLSFNDGSSALFKRRIYRLGSLFTTDSGVFSQNSVLAPPSAGTTNGQPTVPPTNASGYTFTMNFGQTPTRDVFQTGATGTQFDDSAPSSFTYTYSAVGIDAFHLVVTFKAGKWDEYDLAYTSGAAGTLVVRRFDKGVLKRTDSGTFSVTVTGP